ncbi:MAG: hypothetical protein WCO94_16225 [Verrucomicrobiota bacterium]
MSALTGIGVNPVSTFGTAAQGKPGQRILRACKSSFLICTLCWCLPALIQAGTDIKCPLLVWDINFNGDPLDKPPRPLTKEQIESQLENLVASLPIKTYSAIEYLTATRRATVMQEAAGLKDKPILFVYEESEQPHYGPRMWCKVPSELAKRGKSWRLSFDVSKGDVEKSGGVKAWDVTSINFHEDGVVRAGNVEIARYVPNKPLHIECVISVPEKTAKITVNGESGRSVEIPWEKPAAAAFSAVTFDGLQPGGFARAPSSIAFDNIRLVMEE